MLRPVLLLLALVLCAGSAPHGENRAAADARQATAYFAKLEIVRKRLVACGGIPDIAARPARSGIDTQRGHSHARLPVVYAATEQLYAEFDAEQGSLIQLCERWSSDQRCRDYERGTSYVCSLSKEKAAELATAYLGAIEGSQPPGPPSLDPYALAQCLGADGSPQTVGPMQTVIADWPRTHGGFAFREDRTSVEISAIDGAFFKYASYHISEPPPVLDVSVGRDESLALAKAAAGAEMRVQAEFGDREPENVVPEGTLLASKAAYERAVEARRSQMRQWAAMFEPLIGVEPRVEREPELLIVNPNEQFADRHEDEEWVRWTPKTRLAWVVRLVYEAPADAPQAWPHLHMEVWIDAENGKLLGGHLPY